MKNDPKIQVSPEAPETESNTDKPSSPANKWIVFFLVAVGIFMSTLDGSIVNIALPVIMRELSTSMARVEWVVMVYLLTVTTLLLNFGRLSDIKGRRWVYVRGLGLFSTGSLMCGLSQGVSWLIVSRACQGVGAAMVMACTPAIIVDTFHPSERGKALGMVGAVVASGLTIGPALGGFILHYFSWRVIFYINIPIGVIAALAAHRMLKGGPADIVRAEGFDWAGAGFLTIGLGTALLVLTHAYGWGFAAPLTVTLSALCLATLAGLVWTELRTQQPILAPAIFRIRLFTFPLIAAVLLFASLFAIVFLMPFFLMNPAGYSSAQAGYLMVALFAALFFVSPVSGSLSDRLGSRWLCTLGMGVLAIAFFILCRLEPSTHWTSIAWRLALAGVGTATFLSPNSAAAMNAVPRNHRGIAAGIVAAARNLGMVLGVGMAGAIFNYRFYTLSGGLNFKHYDPQMEAVFMAAFHSALRAGGILAVCGMVVAFLRGPDRRKKVSWDHPNP